MAKGAIKGFQRGTMTERDKVFAGSIPKFYNSLMVPLIFEAYAADLAEIVAASSHRSVLETAAGSGVVTRALAPQLCAGARYVATDLNQPMLDYAATRPGAIAGSNGDRPTRTTLQDSSPARRTAITISR